ncbi:MAG: EamA family transporter [Clostridia bacterium]|nr:EamA family transporter [Clostridia bacterium]
MEKHRAIGELGLVMVTVIWGSTFIITKLGLAQFPPFTYLAIRFVLAFGVLMMLFGREVLQAGRRTWLAGGLIGLILFLGFATQTAGLQFTTAAKSGFITGLSVVLTPIMAALILKQKTMPNVLVGALLAFSGLSVLAYNPEVAAGLNLGDLLTLLCALAFACHIVVVAKYAPNMDTGVFTTIQLGVAGVACSLMSLLLEKWPAHLITAWTWVGLVYMGVVATALVFFIQNWAQRYTTPGRAAVIFTLEPVFTAVFACFILNELLTWRSLLGGGLILGGILIAEIKWGKSGVQV